MTGRKRENQDPPSQTEREAPEEKRETQDPHAKTACGAPEEKRGRRVHRRVSRAAAEGAQKKAGA